MNGIKQARRNKTPLLLADIQAELTEVYEDTKAAKKSNKQNMELSDDSSDAATKEEDVEEKGLMGINTDNSTQMVYMDKKT